MKGLDVLAAPRRARARPARQSAVLGSSGERPESHFLRDVGVGVVLGICAVRPLARLGYAKAKGRLPWLP